MREDFDKLSVARLQFDQKLQVALVMNSLLKSTTALESRANDELTLELVKTKLIDEAMKQGSYNESVMKFGSRLLSAAIARNQEKQMNCWKQIRPPRSDQKHRNNPAKRNVCGGTNDN